MDPVTIHTKATNLAEDHADVQVQYRSARVNTRASVYFLTTKKSTLLQNAISATITLILKNHKYNSLWMHYYYTCKQILTILWKI